MAKLSVIKSENIANQIHFIRGEKVMLDSDLAALYARRNKSTQASYKT